MIPRPGVVLSLVAAAGLGAACVTTKAEGDALRGETAALKSRLDAIDQRDAEAREQMAKLKKVLDEATDLLTRNSADVGAKVQKAEQDLAALEGRLAELEHGVAQVQKQVSDDHLKLEAVAQVQEELRTTQQRVVDRVAPTMPEDKEQLFAAAKGKLDGGYWDDARRFYRSFVQRFPQDPRAAQALLGVGLAYVAERKFPQAVGEFQKVLAQFPKAPEVPEAMWQLALAFEQMKFCTDAKVLLGDIIKRFPKAERLKDVRQKLKDLDRVARDKDKCTS